LISTIYANLNTLVEGFVAFFSFLFESLAVFGEENPEAEAEAENTD